MSTQQTGLVAGNRQNTPGGSTGRSRSKFPLSYSQFQTERFAEYVPFFVEEGVSSDRLPFHSNHEVQTYTLKSPILQSLSKKKDYFAVPMQAILPLNWEKWYTKANIGQDAPDDAGCGVVGFWTKMRTLFNNSWIKLGTDLADTSLSDTTKLEEVLKFLLFFENIYSTGSLMKLLRISGSNYFRCDLEYASGKYLSVTYDDLFDGVINVISTWLSSGYVFDFTIGSDTFTVCNQPLDVARSNKQQINLREALELMRDDLTFAVSFVSSGGTLLSNIRTCLVDYDPQLPATDADLNLSRLWAYQLVIAHFYSNDHVDFIYSAELFRQYVLQVGTRNSSSGAFAGTNPVPRFTVNGLQYDYDALSAKIFDGVLNGFGSSGIFSYTAAAVTSDSLNEAYAYFTALFGIKRSLRFLDYFTGSRSMPLAGVMNTTVNVNSNQVDIIELSRTSMMTKLLQAVNRSGRKFSAYMQELFGKTPAYDYHNPMYLAHTSDLVGAEETQNTGSDQLIDQISVTSRLRASSSRYAFEFTPDRDCIVIGITYYDLPRVYLRSTDKQTFVINKFDMFNPYLQFIGDQSISEAEIGTDTPSISFPFSYTNRHMEYKQRWNYGAGGFCVPSTGLDNWIFPADMMRRKLFHHIGSSFVRSFNSELDRFYTNLTGWSLGTYFHFIVRYDNRQDASRPMAYNPVISI